MYFVAYWRGSGGRAWGYVVAEWVCDFACAQTGLVYLGLWAPEAWLKSLGRGGVRGTQPPVRLSSAGGATAGMYLVATLGWLVYSGQQGYVLRAVRRTSVVHWWQR